MIGKLSLKYKSDLKIIGVALLYYLSAKLGFFFAFDNSMLLPAWPPSGIGFALIILMGRAAWPGITIGSLVASVMAYWNNPHLPPQTFVTVSSIIAAAQTLEAVMGNYMVKEWIKDDYPFRNPKNAFRFLLVSLCMCMLGSGIGTLFLYLNNAQLTGGLLKTGFSLWVGSVVGILLFTPIILATAKKPALRFSKEKAVEVGVFILMMAGLYMLLQVHYLTPTLVRALPFIMLPCLLWFAFRFELIVALSGVLLVSLISIYLTVNGSGPFVLKDSYNSMLLLQIFIGVISISTIVLSATVNERESVQQQLKEFNENLESIVQTRTQALNKEIDIRRLAEERIVRTNHELSKRNTELDNFVYSVSHDLRAPIASVLGLINVARKDKALSMKDKYLDMIHQSAMQQDDFIKAILDQSRNSRLELKRDEILFEPLINETFAQLRFATSTEQTVHKIIHVEQESPFYSDRWRLKVILNNIISNSIRYRNGKDPVIKVNVIINHNQAVLAIQDNGKGIGEEHLPNIYKMFYRATDDGAGSGLGLYIVKEAIDKLNGHIDIESEVGKGTTVKFNIPELDESGLPMR